MTLPTSEFNTASPAMRYATTPDGLKLAYWAIGSGPPLIVMPAFFCQHLEREWAWEQRRQNYEILASHFTVIRFDGRGLGLSDRSRQSLAPEALLSDIEVIADALELPRFALLAERITVPLALTYAATYPKRVSQLILWRPIARLSESYGEPELRPLLSLIDKDWHLYNLVLNTARRGWANANAARERAAIASVAATPEYAARLVEAWREHDAVAEAARIIAPTLLILEPKESESQVGQARMLASLIKNCELSFLDVGAGNDFLDDDGVQAQEILAFIEKFPSSPFSTPLKQLSVREEEILRLLAKPLTTREIAAHLAISVMTLERHTANLYRKLGVHSRIEAVFALSQGGNAQAPEIAADADRGTLSA